MWCYWTRSLVTSRVSQGDVGETSKPGPIVSAHLPPSVWAFTSRFRQMIIIMVINAVTGIFKTLLSPIHSTLLCVSLFQWFHLLIQPHGFDFKQKYPWSPWPYQKQSYRYKRNKTGLLHAVELKRELTSCTFLSVDVACDRWLLLSIHGQLE